MAGRMNLIARKQLAATKVHTFDGSVGIKPNDKNAASFLPTTIPSSLGEPSHAVIDIASKSISDFKVQCDMMMMMMIMIIINVFRQSVGHAGRGLFQLCNNTLHKAMKLPSFEYRVE